ncbi:MAG: class I SAM-dependent RNA methyltransferase [Firmicutes bacterium]|nr:class I SAM-dependent RNA methyltransferase [Bacillota bacterium]
MNDRNFEIIATSTFGLEAVVKREIEALGYEITDSRNGRLTYRGDLRALVRSNLWLRCADRVYVKMGEFTAKTFDELFRAAEALPWEDWLPVNAHFSVTGSSARSILHSVPACQSIIEKAIVKRLGGIYGVERFAKNGPVYAVRFMAQKDEFVLMINSSGPGLHDRGYRVKDVPAPIKETMAAAMVSLSFFKPGRFLVDPFCGSGTIAIEAAMMARNIAPGLTRKFDCSWWEQIPEELWKEEKAAAYKAMDLDAQFKILACDIDSRAVRAAKKNAEAAGVDDCIDFKVCDVKDLAKTVEKYVAQNRIGSAAAANATHGTAENGAGQANHCADNGLKDNASSVDLDRGVIIANPPYGIRIGEAELLPDIYESIRTFVTDRPQWSLFLITSDKTFETAMGRPADRRRKLYNGDLEVCYYQYYGTK